MQNNHTRARLVNNAVNNGEGNYCHTRSGPRFLLLFTLLLWPRRSQRQNEREIHTTQKCLCGESYDFSVSSSLAFSFGYCFARNFHAAKASCALLLPFLPNSIKLHCTGSRCFTINCNTTVITYCTMHLHSHA